MTTTPIEQGQALEVADLNRRVTESWAGTRDWRTTLSNALIVTRREVRDSFRDWRIVVPIFLLTLVFPFLANFASNLFIGLFEDYGEADTDGFLEAFLPLMPMLVGFFPISISLVIALETFVGEKERLSLEPLLSTPLTNTELYMGKVLSAILPPLLAGYLGISMYVSFQVFGPQQWRPEPILIVQIVLLTAVQAILMVTGAVVISSQTTSTRAANLLASFIIIPMSFVVIGESLIMIQPDRRFVLWWIMLGLSLVIVLLMRTGARIFNREELLGRAIDNLNLRWAWRTFADQWRSGVAGFSPLGWYRQSVWPSLKSLRSPLMAWTICALGFFIFGWAQTSTYLIPLDSAEMSSEERLDNVRDLVEYGQGNPQFSAFVLEQNTRVLMLATFLSIFSMGVAGLSLTCIVFGVLGFAFGTLAGNDVDILPFIFAVIPHGIFEIPAIAIAGAGALRLGAIVTRPPSNMTVGEAWLRALSDAVKIGVAVVFPLLIIAALVEVQITPAVVEWALTNL